MYGVIFDRKYVGLYIYIYVYSNHDYVTLLKNKRIFLPAKVMIQIGERKLPHQFLISRILSYIFFISFFIGK